MTIKNDPINAIIHPVSGECEYGGLTKREYFAAMAMQAFLHEPPINIKRVAELAVDAADALIEQLNK